MRKLRLLALLLLAATSCYAQSISKVVFTWSYSYATVPVCSTSTTSDCIQSFTLSVGSTTIATIPATSATSYTYTLTPLPAPGTYTYSLIATELLSGTSTITSAPATVTLQVPTTPAVPSNFNATFQ